MNEAPLAGILVVELASVLAGPSVGMFLAEMGAQVVKVEHFKAGGDVTRTWKLKTESLETDRPAYFSAVNWGKDSVGIDLSRPAGQQLVQALAARADIVLVSYKPGDAIKLGMDADTLRARNPRLIYAALTAYGEDDPRPGFDAIIQAEAGFTYMNGQPDSGPVKMPVALMDLLAAHQLKEAILLALLRRERTGQGGTIAVSLIQSALASLANQATNWLVGGVIPSRIGSEHPNIVPYGTLYRTTDRSALVLAVGSDTHFRRLCEVLGVDALADDPRYATNAERVRNRVPLNDFLADRICQQERDPLLAALAEAGVPAGAVRDLADALAQPHAQPLLLAGDGLQALRGAAFTLDGLPVLPLSPPPHLGSATAHVLRTLLGLSDAELHAHSAQGVIMPDGPR
jgi:crotonobetainyl-CoA:carnitine CoA-transferase CaiB-like acyl-CoA transferase